MSHDQPKKQQLGAPPPLADLAADLDLPDLPVPYELRPYDGNPDEPWTYRKFPWFGQVGKLRRSGGKVYELNCALQNRQTGVVRIDSRERSQRSGALRYGTAWELPMKEAMDICRRAAQAAEPIARKLDLIDRSFSLAAHRGGPAGFSQRAGLALSDPGVLGGYSASELSRWRAPPGTVVPDLSAIRWRDTIKRLCRISEGLRRALHFAEAGVYHKSILHLRAAELDEAAAKSDAAERRARGELARGLVDLMKQYSQLDQPHDRR